jgi:magnesium transporter
LNEPAVPIETPEPTIEKPWERLRRLAGQGDRVGIRHYLDELTRSDRVHALSRLDARTRAGILELLPPGRAASVLGEIPGAQVVATLELLPPATSGAILSRFRSNVRAALLSQLSTSADEAIRAELTPEEVEQADLVLGYAPSTAGHLMITEYVAVPEDATGDAVIAELRANAERYATYVVQYVYVVGPDGELRGVLPLRDLMLVPGWQSVRDLMVPAPLAVPAETPLDELRTVFSRHGFRAMPVVDRDGRLVGILLREALNRARADAAEADALKARGIVGGDELRSMPVLLRSRRRLSWLSINIVLNVLAASVIALYEDTIQAVIALAVFLPIISDMSGCSGNQAVAVSLRELTLGVTRPSDIARVLAKEAALGLINGLVLGLLLGILATLWRGNPVLGLVVGAALSINTLVSVCIGGAVPLFIRRLGFDPALASGPMLTTVTDMCGFFLVLSLATATLGQLQG